MPVLEQAILFTETRHKVLAQNIANLDTPYYREKDLSVEAFQEALSDAVQRQRQTGSPFTMTASTSAEGREPAWTKPIETGRSNGLRHDESTISPDKLMAKLSKNTLMHNALVDLLAKQYRMLGAAIRGRPS